MMCLKRKLKKPMELVELFMKYRESYKGQVMSGVLKKLDTIAKILLKRHDINCCSKHDTEHLNSNVALVKKF